MSAASELFLILFALYLSECVLWIRRTTAGLRVSWAGRRVAHPPELLGNDAGGLLLGSPLPPLSPLFLVHAWPLAVTPRGILDSWPAVLDPAHRPPPPRRFTRFEDLPPFTVEGPWILAGSGARVHAGSAPRARRWSSWLEELRTAAEDQRQARILEHLERFLDPGAAAHKVQRFLKDTRALAFAVNGLFLYTFVAAPLWSYRVGLVRCWREVLVGFAGLWLLALLSFLRAHRRCSPGETGHRWYRTILMTLLPLSCIRARDYLAHHVLENEDPVVAIAGSVPGARARVRAAVRHLYFLVPPPDPEEPPEVREALRWFHGRYFERLTGALETLGLAWSEALDPPRTRQRDAVAYCPRCLDQFRAGRSRCEACTGQPLVPFPDLGATG